MKDITLQIRNLFAVLALLSLLTPTANSQVITVLGAIAVGSAGAMLCEGLVVSHMEEAPESDEPWYRIHYHVGFEDIASVTAGTVCAIPAAAVGGAVGALVDTGTLAVVTTTGAGVVIVTTAKGVKYLYKRSPVPKYVEVATETSKDLFSKARKSIAETTSAWKTATPSHLRKHMPQLYNRQNGRDALCDVPLPPLYVGQLWNRRLNPAIEVDHALPRAWGGSDDLSNLQLTHKEYNRAKGTRVDIFLENAKKQFCSI